MVNLRDLTLKYPFCGGSKYLSHDFIVLYSTLASPLVPLCKCSLHHCLCKSHALGVGSLGGMGAKMQGMHNHLPSPACPALGPGCCCLSQRTSGEHLSPLHPAPPRSLTVRQRGTTCSSAPWLRYFWKFRAAATPPSRVQSWSAVGDCEWQLAPVTFPNTDSRRKAERLAATA